MAGDNREPHGERIPATDMTSDEVVAWKRSVDNFVQRPDAAAAIAAARTALADPNFKSEDMRASIDARRNPPQPTS